MLGLLLTLWVTRHEGALKRQLRIPADVGVKAYLESFALLSLCFFTIYGCAIFGYAYSRKNVDLCFSIF
jgi:hypothetical protein